MKNTVAIPGLLIITLICHSAAFADFYKWTDKNGVLHMSTTPPDQTEGSSGVKIEREQEKTDNKATGNQPDKPNRKVYTSEATIQAKRDYLNARIEYNRGECKTRPLGPGEQRLPNREEICDKDATHYEGMLRSLESDPDRFFYVEDQLKKKNTGAPYDNPPRYPLTYFW